MDNKIIKIGEAARFLGVDVSTVRRWEITGELLPARRSRGGVRFYNTSDLIRITSGVGVIVNDKGSSLEDKA